MIILEGPDGAGKTTLKERLLEDLDLRELPRACTSDNGPIDFLASWVQSNLGAKHQPNKIIDRHPLISEPIYGPLLRGGFVDTKFENTQWLWEQMSEIYAHHLIVYCLPPLAVCLENIERGHEGTTEHLQGVLVRGRAIWSQYHTRMAVDLAWESQYRRNGFHHILVWDYTIRGSYRDLISNLGHYLDHGVIRGSE